MPHSQHSLSSPPHLRHTSQTAATTPFLHTLLAPQQEPPLQLAGAAPCCTGAALHLFSALPTPPPAHLYHVPPVLDLVCHASLQHLVLHAEPQRAPEAQHVGAPARCARHAAHRGGQPPRGPPLQGQAILRGRPSVLLRQAGRRAGGRRRVGGGWGRVGSWSGSGALERAGRRWQAYGMEHRGPATARWCTRVRRPTCGARRRLDLACCAAGAALAGPGCSCAGPARAGGRPGQAAPPAPPAAP